MGEPIPTAPPTEAPKAPERTFRAWLQGGSGPAVANLFHKLLALVFLDAWISLGVQVHELIGSRGLLPVAPWLEAARAAGAGLAELPTVLWLGASDEALLAGVVLGGALAVAALAGVRPRACFALSALLYLGYVVGGRTFMSFQWDNLLLECAVLAAMLPADRRAAWIHWLMRLLLYKLYFESGVAKLQSHLGDWSDGSAMSVYYETAPLPAWPAWYAHALPAWWHAFESRATLALELGVPAAFFGPRLARVAAFFALTAFQIVNLATANYGFFVHLALALHVFLLDEADVERAAAVVGRWRGRAIETLRARGLWRKVPAPKPAAEDAPGRDAVVESVSFAWSKYARRYGVTLVVLLYVEVSIVGALDSFRRDVEVPAPFRLPSELLDPLRIVNTYHLFGHITRERIEPVLETFDGATWTEHDMRHKPGDLTRAPGFVAPHQPRVDFQLWFYGLSYERGMPPWVRVLLLRACEDPDAIAGLYTAPLPARPAAVRLSFWRYRFTTPAERRATGTWWKRALLATLPYSACGRGD